MLVYALFCEVAGSSKQALLRLYIPCMNTFLSPPFGGQRRAFCACGLVVATAAAVAEPLFTASTTASLSFGAPPYQPLGILIHRSRESALLLVHQPGAAVEPLPLEHCTPGSTALRARTHTFPSPHPCSLIRCYTTPLRYNHAIHIHTYAPHSRPSAGADDTKVKVYQASTGFCFVTFTDHTAPITGLAFLPSGHALISASLDGTVRAYDLVRYRNFRTMTTPEPVQFGSLAVDPSGEVVCAGSLDTFQIYVWSVKTGRLLDVLAGHEGPVSHLSFSPGAAMLASSSWDKTVQLWDVFNSSSATGEAIKSRRKLGKGEGKDRECVCIF